MRSRRPLQLLEPAEAYALWAPSYDARAHNPLMRAEEAAMRLVLDGLNPRRAVDVGTGSGRYLAWLADCRTPDGSATSAVGLNLSPGMLARNTSGAPLVQGDALFLPFGNGVFDLVVSSLTVGHIQELDGWSAECSRVLEPGGHLVFSDVHPSWEAAGWLRTFNTADGRLFAVRQHWRSLQDVCRSLAAHGLTLMRLDEPRLHIDDSPAVAAWRRHWGNPPVAFVVHAVKRA